MAVVFVCQYDVTNPDMYAKYNPGSLETIMKVLTEVGGSLVARPGCATSSAEMIGSMSCGVSSRTHLARRGLRTRRFSVCPCYSSGRSLR